MFVLCIVITRPWLYATLDLVKQKTPKNLTAFKHPNARIMWETQRSTTKEEVSHDQAVRNIGCYKLLVEHHTSESPLHKLETWIFVILGKEPNVTNLEGNWMNLLKERNLQFSSSPKLTPDGASPMDAVHSNGYGTQVSYCPDNAPHHFFAYNLLPHLYYQC